MNKNCIKQAYILTFQSNEMARGEIILKYENSDNKKTYHVPYNTFHGPDGFNTVVEKNPGEKVRLEEGSYEKLPEYVREQAVETLFNYKQEAKEAKDTTEQGSVVFSGRSGINDGWLPD